jgi:steroid 5-alpha reductase family enzyme
MPFPVYPKIALLILIFMCTVFVIAQIKKNNSIIDYFWGLGFCAITVFLILYYKQQDDATNRIPFFNLLIFSSLIFIWGLRLSAYIFIRNWGMGEDWRYRNFRKTWGNHPVIGAFFQVFLLQGFFLFIISLPIIHVFYQGIFDFNYFHYFGFFIWLLGFIFETVGDAQLYRYKKKPEHKGKPIQSGLWKYTRHPNYFGEILTWWGIWILSVNFFHPVTTLVSLISPLTITWLLTKVSGVPLTESKYKNNPEYQDYIQKTPALFPKFF